MQILPVIKQLLLTRSAVTAILRGSIWNNEAGQNDALPNIVMGLIGGSDDLTHQGPDGLMRQTIRLYSRGRTDVEAATLGEAARRALHGATFSALGINVLLCQHTNQVSDFNAEANVQRQIDSYMVAWRYSA